MKNRFNSKSAAGSCRGGTSPAPKARRPRARRPRSRPLLLISDDAAFAEVLRRAGEPSERAILQAREFGDALRQMEVMRPAAILLDLDLASNAAWEIADRLLQEAACPPLLFVTGRTGDLDLGPASRTGAVFDKTSEPTRLVENLPRTRTESSSSQAETNAIQRIFIRWLRPCEWPVPIGRAYRWWGMNE